MDLKNIQFKNKQLILPVILHNPSDHEIDLAQTQSIFTITSNGKNNFQKTYPGEAIFIQPGSKHTIFITLDKNISSRLLNGVTSFTGNFIIQSTNAQDILGKYKQSLKLTTGPIINESLLNIELKPASLRYNSTNSCYQVTLTATIKNINQHLINLKKLTYKFDVTIGGSETVEKVVDGTVLLKDKEDIFLVQEESFSFTAIIKNLDSSYTEEQAKAWFAKQTFSSTLKITSHKGKHVLGTQTYNQ